MKVRTLLLVSCLVASTSVGSAQSKAAADRLSGTWTGSMASKDGDRQPITVTLKFDGKTVTGLITGPPHPGDITGGTFDAASGALKLEIVVRNDGKTPVVFTGKVAKDTASGSVAMNGADTGVFNMTKQRAGQSTSPPPPSAKPAAGKRTEQEIEAAFNAHKGDFDYLLGDWEFTAESKEHGRFRGFWSAVKLYDGQILDEYRVVGDKLETYYVTTTLRNYNKTMDRWELIGADAGAGLQDFGTGHRVGNEVQIEQRFGVAAGAPSTWRIRYFNIKPDSFSWSADRSTDGGQTWMKNHQTIEARRIGAARSLGPLAPAKKGS